MKIIAGTSAFILLTLLFSCEELNIISVNCNECSQDDLTMISINIKLDSRLGVCLIKVYEGNLEDNVLFNSWHSQELSSYINVPINRKYTLTATYNSENGNSYVVVDAVTPHVRYDKVSCDEPCYYPYDNNADLRLKHMK